MLKVFMPFSVFLASLTAQQVSQTMSPSSCLTQQGRLHHVQDNVCPYWGARKPWYVRSLHQAVHDPWRFPLVEGTPLFRAWVLAKSLKFWALSSMLSLIGQKRRALQVTKGWKVGQKIGIGLGYCGL